jgi:hypothetical protein
MCPLESLNWKVIYMVFNIESVLGGLIASIKTP